MKKWSICIFMFVLLLLTGCGGAPAPQTAENEQEIAIRLATNYRDDSIGYQQLQDFARLLRFVEHADIHPVIDSTFGLADARAAFAKVLSGDVFGKVVVRI